MTEAELAQVIEASKHTVLRAIGRYLPAELGGQLEDIAQETYLRYFLAFRSKTSLKGDELLRWLYVAARNETHRAARKNRREWFAFLRREESQEPEPGRDAGEGVDDIELSTEEMPEPFRQTMQLRAAGLKMSEIAARLGVSPGTVKSRLSRGKELLARSVSEKQRKGVGL